MRALFQIRPNHADQSGGDTVHAVRTAEELRPLGVETDISGDLAPDLSGYDLIHLFNTELVEPTFRHVLRARQAGLPIVLTPIYWRPPLEDESFDEVDRANLRHRNSVMRDIVFGLSDALLPPTEAELGVITAAFEPLPRRVAMIPVGVDAVYAEGDGERFCARHDLPLRGFVLCVGRLEERKNQLRLIEACASVGAPLVLVGAEYEDRLSYAASCRELAEKLGADVRFLSYVDDAEVVDAYAAARVHALPSLWETIGLASLEAAVAGCNVVTTQNCGVGEYVGDFALYCDPESVDSIREAVASALGAPLDNRLAERVSAYTWSRAAENTLAVYEAVMGERAEGIPGADWRAALTPEQYIEHLESLIQLQLESIAFRDAHYANAREQAERAVEYAQSLEVERERLQAELEKSEPSPRRLRRWR
jgi:glycosyltransferase involved in cell wall biosynthesis